MQQDSAKILEDFFKSYTLDIYGNKTITPYRINIPYQEDRRKYGKSDPKELKENLIEIARNKNFDLKVAKSKEIRKFMKDNMLGVDCSGFVYHCLNYLLEKTQNTTMEELGFPKASSTNALKLASNEFTVPIKDIKDIKTGDMIIFHKGSEEDIAHILLVQNATKDKITYIQSTSQGEDDGVKKNTIIITDPEKGLESQKWTEVFPDGTKRVQYFNTNSGDGVRRLKVLS